MATLTTNPQAKTQSEILAEILTQITTNGTGNITALMLQNILRDITTTCYGSTYLFPVDSSVLTTDVGKLMMNDGSGTAKVYQLSPAQPQQLGKWSLTPPSLSAFNSTSQIIIKMNGNTYTYSRPDWDWPSNPPAATVREELNYIRLFLLGQPQFAGKYHFYLSSDGNTLYIDELQFQGTIISINSFSSNSNGPSFPLQVIQASHDAIPPIPAYFPLGKFQGYTDSGALLTCNMVETYTLDPTLASIPPPPATVAQLASAGITNIGQLNILNNLYNNLVPISLTGGQDIYNLVTQIIVPSANGTATFLDVSRFNFFNNNFLNVFEYHFLGFAISANATTVTVYNNSFLSLFASLFIKIIKQGILPLGGSTDSPYSPPATGSGSGSGSGSGY